jgi:hypothetical protein
MGLTATCGKKRSSLCANAARHRAERAAGTALSPVWTLCGIDAMWRDRCDACSCREERSRLTRCRRLQCGAALSQPEYRSSADPAATPKSERPSGRRRSRTGGRLRVSPLTQCRATLKLLLHRNYPAANFVPNPGSLKTVPLLDREACASSRQLSDSASNRLTRATTRRHNSTIRSTDPRCSAVSSSS